MLLNSGYVTHFPTVFPPGGGGPKRDFKGPKRDFNGSEKGLQGSEKGLQGVRKGTSMGPKKGLQQLYEMSDENRNSI